MNSVEPLFDEYLLTIYSHPPQRGTEAYAMLKHAYFSGAAMGCGRLTQELVNVSAAQHGGKGLPN